MQEQWHKIAALVVLLASVAWECGASVTGSDWREQSGMMDGAIPADSCSAALAVRRVAVGHLRVCYINVTGAGSGHSGPVSCFGAGLLFPDGLVHKSFTEVSVGSQHVCAIRAADKVTDRQAICWGTKAGDQFGQISTTPEGGLHSVCAGSYYTCALIAEGQGRLDEGSALCWGESEMVRTVEQRSQGRRLRQLACGDFAVCVVIAETGLVECWGDDDLDAGAGEVQTGARLIKVSLGVDHACALRLPLAAGLLDAAAAEAAAAAGAEAVCWGSNWMNAELGEQFFPSAGTEGHGIFVGKAAPPGPATRFVDLSVGVEHVCGVTTSGGLVCWGAFVAMGGKGVPPGNHWVAAVAGYHTTCAVSLVGGGTLACWGDYVRTFLDTINAAAVTVCRPPNRTAVASRATDSAERAAGAGAQVVHYGPDLSSLDSLDGTWLHVLPAALSLARDPFITILSPDAHRVLEIADLGASARGPVQLQAAPQGTEAWVAPPGEELGAGELRVEVLLSRMQLVASSREQDEGPEAGARAHVLVRIDGVEVPSRRLAPPDPHTQPVASSSTSELSAGPQGPKMKHPVEAGASLLSLAVDVAGLARGMHEVEASLLLASRSPAAGHSVSFWLAPRTPHHAQKHPGAAGEAIAGADASAEACSRPAAPGQASPSVEVVSYRLREMGTGDGRLFHDMAAWIVLDNFKIGVDGWVLFIDSTAKVALTFAREVEWGAEVRDGFLRRLAPIASVACKAGRCTVTKVLSKNSLIPCAVGASVPWRGVDKDYDLVLYELGVPVHPEPEQSCLRRPYSVSLTSTHGVGIEEGAALSQWHVDLYCDPGEVPPGVSMQRDGAVLEAEALLNKPWADAPWLHGHNHLARLNTRGNPSCFWYSGPLAGTPEWQQISSAIGEGYSVSGSSASPAGCMCGLGEFLSGGRGALALKNAAGSPMPAPHVVGFYHVSTVGDRWIKTARRQLALLRFSKTHHAVDKIVVGTSGHFADVVGSLAQMMENNKTAAERARWGDAHKFNFVDHSRKQKYLDLGGSHIAREVPTLQLMFEHCQLPAHADHIVFYLHSKGVGHTWPKYKWTQDWTRYMEAMLFEKPELCLHALLQGRAAACGVELYQIPFLHYAGNFWWTTCRRVRKLAEPDSMLPMTASTWGLPENWIGSVGDDSMLSLFNAYWSNPYATDLERQHYMPVAELLPCVACPGCDPSPLA